ncbi:Chromatin assembly factor 1 subunit B [Frankliniella fusca]|uniref:Chromatin assembly factor 1 subunit B n=1 Tax=Frankliniella fusca TaxID=407009 RepID=A0AAE1HAQ6_9NEOP|nr:Chromatin assembly factor 1 subunit B [Frankliniella fusca]
MPITTKGGKKNRLAMRCTIPEISWHNRDPVLSIDIQKQHSDEPFYRLASGGTDSHVLIWHVKSNEDGTTTVDFASDLVRHQKAVNAVRFSPCGSFLASGDDESAIIIWKKRQDSDAPDIGSTVDAEANKESWIVLKILRGHLEDVYDLCWSPDSTSLISGSVDNTAIVWDIHKGSRAILQDHKGFVQGVSWDPKNDLLATLSSDRKLRVFQANSKKIVARVGKAPLPVPKDHNLHGKKINLFHDDTIQTFFRRLTFSPDGELLIVPSGVIEPQEAGKKPASTTLVFSRRLLNRPVCYLPSLDQYSVCVKCCPVLFELRNIDPSTKPESMFALPYRVIFAVATASAVVLYDTQQPMPFGYVSNLHYTRLTDLAWSPKGDLLMVSSTDGYCSIITFSPGELGIPYEQREEISSQPKSEAPINNSVSTNQEADDVSKLVSSQSEKVANIDLGDDDDFEGIKKLDEEIHEEKKKPREDSLSNMNVQKLSEENSLTSNSTNCNSPELKSSVSGTDPSQACDSASTTIAPNVGDVITTPGNSGKKARRVQLITLSSPKSKKKLL